MSCNRIEDLLAEHRDALRSEIESSPELREHLETCAACADSVGEHEAVAEALAPLAAIRPVSSPISKKRFHWEVIVMAASILVCVATLWTALVQEPAVPPSVVPAASRQEPEGSKERFVFKETATHQSLSLSDDRAEVDGVELKVRSTKELKYAGAYKNVELSLGAGVIEARGADVKEMAITLTYFEKAEGDLEIGLKKGETEDAVTFTSKSENPFVIAKIEIVIPMKRALKLNSVNGFVKLLDYKTELPVELSTSNAAVCMERVSASKAALESTNGAVDILSPACDELKVSTSNGAVTVGKARVKTLSIKTSNGGVSIDGSTCDKLRAETTNGNIRWTNSKCDDRKFTTVNGQVEED